MTTLEFTRKIEATPEQIYFTLTTSPILGQWLADYVEFQRNEDGRFYAWWNDGHSASGLVKEVKENEEVVFTWNGLGEPGESKVRFLLEGNGSKETKLTVQHDNLGEGEAWNEFKKTIGEEWPKALDNLEHLFTKGVDKRVFDRPFLGIMIAGAITTDEQAQEYSLPETKGVRINSTVPDTGAAEADLEENDIFWTLGGKDASSFRALNAALSTCKAGDTVDVELYRKGDKLTVPLRLSHRPMPEIPATPKELADRVREINKEVAKELEDLFEGVSEAEASKRPAEEEWCAKEVVAHLLMTEIWQQFNITTTIAGFRGPGYSNDLGTVKAMADGYGDAQALLDIFKRNMEITAAALEGLPEATVGRKFNYVGLCNTALNLNQHSRSHYAQITNAIEAARK